MKKIYNTIRQWPLYSRLTLFFGTVLFIIFSILLFTAQYFYVHFVYNQFELRAKTIADNLAQVCVSPLLNYDEVTLNQNSVSIAQQKDILYVAIMDARGKVLSNVIRDKTTGYFPDFDKLSQKIDQSFVTDSEFHYINEKSVLEVIQAIKIQGINWGYIFIGLDLSDFNNIVSRARWLSLAIGLVFIIIAIFTVQKVTEKLISPVRDLIRGTEEVSKGNFDFRIEMDDQAEFGQLGQKFNDMIQKLNYYHREKELLNKKLHDYSEGLEEKIKERTRQLEQIQNEVVQIFHQIPIGLLTINRNGAFHWYNDELLKIFDIKNKNLLKKARIDKDNPFRQKAFSKKLKNIFEKGQKTEFQFMYQVRKGDKRLLEVHSQPLTVEQEKQSGMIFIVKDITREAELLKSVNRVQRLESMGILAGEIAHDFNNALAIILPNAQMLKLKLKDDKRLIHYVETIEKATEQAAKLTSQILSFSRGDKKGKKEVFNLNELIEEFSMMLGRILSRKIVITKNLNSNLWNIEADKSQIEQALMNLTMNAADAMPEGGEIHYQTSNIEILDEALMPAPKMEKGKYVLFEVIDTGMGIPNQVLDKIFDPFFSSKPEGKGTGLGLSIVYGIVNSYGGFIDVHSEINKGTRFTIYLPATLEEKQIEEQETLQILPGSGKILLVDDEEMLRETVSHMLENMKYEVMKANNGKEAVRLYRKQQKEIDMIIMDIQMPEMDGIEAAITIWNKSPDTKIIFSSGYAEPARFEELRKRGIKQILRKPYKIKDLVEIIQKTLNNHS